MCPTLPWFSSYLLGRRIIIGPALRAERALMVMKPLGLHHLREDGEGS